MLNEIKGLHHVASMAADARRTKGFFTDALGRRQGARTVNSDEPGKGRLVPPAG